MKGQTLSYLAGAAASIITVTVLFSCKTPPPIEVEKETIVEEPKAAIVEEPKEESASVALQVNPLDLLPKGQSFYMTIPKEVDEELLRRVIVYGVKDIPLDTAAQLLRRIDTAYIALERSYNVTMLQMTAAGIAQSGVESALPDGVAFPTDEVGLLAKDIEVLLASYNAHAYGGERGHLLQDEVYQWLSGKGKAGDTGGLLGTSGGTNGAKQIRFYALKPQSFLTILIGTRLNFKFEWIRGTLYTDPKLNTQYIMAIDFNFKDAHSAQEGRTSLDTAFNLSGGSSYMASPTQLTVTGIRISRRQLYKLFVL